VTAGRPELAVIATAKVPAVHLHEPE
jgi:hypothetical protein